MTSFASVGKKIELAEASAANTGSPASAGDAIGFTAKRGLTSGHRVSRALRSSSWKR